MVARAGLGFREKSETGEEIHGHAEMVRSDSHGTNHMPVWSEEAGDFDDVVEECVWYRKGFKEAERHLATARIARGFRERNGTAWRLVKALLGATRLPRRCSRAGTAWSTSCST